jgi:hypothetical protein
MALDERQTVAEKFTQRNDHKRRELSDGTARICDPYRVPDTTGREPSDLHITMITEEGMPHLPLD